MNLQELKDAAEAATPGPWEWINPEDDSPWDGRGYASLRTVKHYGEDKTEVRNGLHYTSFSLPKFLVEAEEITHISDATFIAIANPTTILKLIAVVEAVRSMYADDLCQPPVVYQALKELQDD